MIQRLERTSICSLLMTLCTAGGLWSTGKDSYIDRPTRVLSPCGINHPIAKVPTAEDPETPS